MSKPRSRETSTTFRLVGGKGGVGKTTCAAALGVRAASRGARVLIVSTDPAPALGDVLGVALGAAPRPVPLRRGRLHAVEIDPQHAFARWLRTRRGALEAIAVRGTWLDEDDVRLLLGLTLPGIDEVASLLELLRYGRSRRFDRVIVDTAPTGHALRLLAMPETLAGLARVFDHMQDKHRAVVQALRGAPLADEADRAILTLQQEARALRELLADPARTAISLVTLPERLAVEEALDAARYLLRHALPLTSVVVNRLTAAPPERCGWCERKRRLENHAVSDLAARLRALAGREASFELSGVAAREAEPVGARALANLALDLERPLRPSPRTPRPRIGAVRVAAIAGVAAETVNVDARLLLFGGKGGAGKTTCAAAAALRLASLDRRRRVLLVSTDPAHSLGDALAIELTDRARAVPRAPANLEVRELDAARALLPLRRAYAASIDAYFDRLAGGSRFDAAHDRRIMHDLLSLAPPGLDEIAAVVGVIDLLRPDAERRYDTLVVDTAPTGHALRLLETPATVHAWTKALMSILLKYRQVANLGELGAALVGFSRRLAHLRQLLVDPHGTAFVVVTRAAAVPRAETERLLATLRRLGIAVPAVVVNAVGAGTCRRCRRIGRRERAEVARLAAALRSGRRGARLVLAPATVPPPVGVAALRAWHRHWRRVDGR